MSQNNTMAIDVLLTQSDYVRIKLRSPLLKEKWTSLGFLFIVIGFIIIHPFISEQKDFSDLLDFTFISLLLLCGFYSNAKRSFANNKSLHESIHYYFDNVGINSSARSSSSHHKWEAIYKAFETKEDFVLFIGEENMYMIPKRCFPNKEDVKTFKSILHYKLGSRAKLKK